MNNTRTNIGCWWLSVVLGAASAFGLESSKLPPELATPSVEAVEFHARGGLPNFFAKLKQGKEVRVAYFGGSITAQDGYRVKTLKWFQSQFPQAKLSEIHAAIGGTGSDLGVFRCQQDVLAKNPDLVFVEFAVNDGGADPAQIYRCMEGIVRQIWTQNPDIDICYVYTIAGNMLETLQTGKYPRSASAMEKLADHYAIPSIHMGLEVARLVKSGKVIFTGSKPKTDQDKQALGDKILFSPDSVHPYTDTGHQLYLEAVVRGMEKIRVTGQPGPHGLKAPFVSDHWAAAKIVPLTRTKLSTGWQKLDPATHKLAQSYQKQLPELWLAGKAGETLSFKFKGIAAGIYDLVGPDCGQLRVTLDEQKASTVLRFDSYCTYHRLQKFMIGSNLPEAVHSAKLEVLPDQPDKAKILSQRKEKMNDPKRFDGINWYAGSILLIGELVE